MLIRFIRDWTTYYTKGTEVVIGPGGLSGGQFVELKRRGFVEVVDEAPKQYRTAVATAPTRKRGRRGKAK